MNWQIDVASADGSELNQNLIELTRSMVTHYAHELGIHRFKNHLKVFFHHESYVDAEDHAAAFFQPWGRRQHQIDLALHNNWCVFLAHEMTHCKQLLRGQVNRQWTHWEGIPVCPSTYYTKLPWEAEAFGRQWELAESCFREIFNMNSVPETAETLEAQA